MAKKKELPDTLTHVQILCLAIRCCEDDIRKYETTYPDNPEAVELMTQDIRRKLNHLQTLYKLETGTEY